MVVFLVAAKPERKLEGNAPQRETYPRPYFLWKYGNTSRCGPAIDLKDRPFISHPSSLEICAGPLPRVRKGVEPSESAALAECKGITFLRECEWLRPCAIPPKRPPSSRICLMQTSRPPNCATMRSSPPIAVMTRLRVLRYISARRSIFATAA